MARQVTMTGLIGFVAFATCLCSRANAQIPLPSPNLPVGCPDTRVWQEGEPATNFGGGIVRSVVTNTMDRNIRLQWKLCEPQLPSVSFPNITQSVMPELFATPYWPTYTTVIDNYHICVVGRTRNGDAVLEYWTFGATTAQGFPAPSVSSYVTIASPTVQYTWALPPRVSVAEVLRMPESQSGLVRAMWRDPGSTQHVFVWYDGSKSVCRVNLIMQTSVLCALPTVQAGSLTVPQLSANFDTFTSGDYVGKGYCLFLSQNTKSPDGSVAPGLALVDSNRDGTLDSFVSLTAAAWVADGWASASVTASY